MIARTFIAETADHLAAIGSKIAALSPAKRDKFPTRSIMLVGDALEQLQDSLSEKKWGRYAVTVRRSHDQPN